MAGINWIKLHSLLTGVGSYCTHPGLVDTQLALRPLSFLIKIIYRFSVKYCLKVRNCIVQVYTK